MRELGGRWAVAGQPLNTNAARTTGAAARKKFAQSSSTMRPYGSFPRKNRSRASPGGAATRC
eukprot:9775264-Alexandrium_andersonii.AAC.1